MVGIGLVGGWQASEGLAGARMEDRDYERASDVGRLARSVECVADQQDGHLPYDLADNESCRKRIHLQATEFGSGFEDRYTGEPYRYAVLTAFRYEICTVLERPKSAPYAFDTFEDPLACAKYRYDPPQDD